MKQNPRVFISYSHDSVEHGDAVLQLSNRLRSEGIDCILDQYEECPPEGWPRWMDAQIRNADFILMICTAFYLKKINENIDANIGLGVKWEGHLIYQHLYDAGSLNNRFIPVLLAGGDVADVPTPLRGATIYRLDNETEYDRLYWRLRGETRNTKPVLGDLRQLPERERKTNPGAFLTGFIDVSLWGPAKWRGVFYMHDEVNPPWLGLLFQNEAPARKIFEQWHTRIGRSDKYEEMRISIIEGDIDGEPPGYSVFISANPLNIFKRADDQGISVPKDLIIILGRLHRMNPPKESRNLAVFKEQYMRFGCYQLFPAIVQPDGVRALKEMAILKKEVVFRDAREITSISDPDTAVIKRLCKNK